MKPQALIRTYTPMIVGALITYLATLGIKVDSDTQAALVLAVGSTIQAAYYTAAHYLETKWPVFSILLGSNATPSYDSEKAADLGPREVATSGNAAPPEDLRQ